MTTAAAAAATTTGVAARRMSRGVRATLSPSRDGRLIPYCVIAVGGLAATLVTGQPALAALAVPFALALAVGLRRTDPLAVTARLILDSDCVLEGDLVTGRIELEWDGPLDAHVLVHRLSGVAAAFARPRTVMVAAGDERLRRATDRIAGDLLGTT